MYWCTYLFKYDNLVFLGDLYAEVEDIHINNFFSRKSLHTTNVQTNQPKLT